MRLQLDIHEVKDAQSGARTEFKDGTLTVNRAELVGVLAGDGRLAEVQIELARPGEKCRIARVIDVIEPRARDPQSGPDFPGALPNTATGKRSAGDGRTAVLRGAAVVLCEPLAPGARGAGDFIDMFGPAAEMTPYGRCRNVVVLARPGAETTTAQYHIALKVAGLKAAAYLARAALDTAADVEETYELASGPAGLPRIAYVFQVLTNQFEPLHGDPVLYGDNVERIVPTVLHPNEVLDGALVAPYSSNFMETFSIQNHPIVQQLYRRDGKELLLAGVIITNAPNNVPEIERAATMAANLAKYTLHADGAVLTKIGGGAPELTMARTAQRCEELGVRTALAFLHMGIDTTDISPKPATIFNAPEIDAMVSMGAPVGLGISLPVPDRVIGGEPDKGEPSRGMRQVKGAMSQIGASKLVAVRY